MPSITVKNIPDEIYDRVKRLATANRRSINSEIIRCLERAVGSRPVDVEATLMRARALRGRSADDVISDEAFDAAKRRGRP